MKRKKLIRVFIGLALAGIISAGLVYRFVVNKPHPDFEKAKPAYIVSASELFDSFRNDRAASESKYNGKVVLLNGRLDKVEATDTEVFAVFVFDRGMFGDEGIRCSMLPAHSANLQSLAGETEITLKGYLAGYNETDVVLEQCSIVR